MSARRHLATIATGTALTAALVAAPVVVGADHGAVDAALPATQLNVSKTAAECNSTRAWYQSMGETTGMCFPLSRIVKVDTSARSFYAKGYRYGFYVG